MNQKLRILTLCISFSLLSFENSHAQSPHYQFEVLSSQSFKAKNPSLLDLNSLEPLIAKKGGSSGTSGGGDFGLAVARERIEALSTSRMSYLRKISSIDWSAHPNQIVRKVFQETVLPHDPIRVMKRLDLMHAHECRGERKKTNVVYVPELNVVCIDIDLSDQYFEKIWESVFTSLFPEASKPEVLEEIKSQEGQRTVLASEIFRDLFNMSLPTQLKLVDGLTCVFVNGQNQRFEVNSEELDQRMTEARQDPSGRWMVHHKNRGYGICE